MKSDQRAKAFLKIGAKALAPFGGDVLLTAVQEFGGLAIDGAASAKAKKVSERILSDLKSDFEEFTRVEGISSEQADGLFEHAATFLKRHPLEHRDWIVGAFDPDRVVANYVGRTGTYWSSVESKERGLLQLIIHGFVRRLVRERTTLDALEAEFRSAVLTGVERISEMARAALSDDRAALAAIMAAALVAVPSRRWRPELSPPGALLRADIDSPVPFHGRTAELTDLLNWCARPDAILVRLFTGSGGMGKSRLLIEACQQMLNAGWMAGFLDRRAVAGDASAFEMLLQHERVFVVIDYAETRRDETRQLLRAAFEAAHNGRARIVFLARSAEDWWNVLRSEGNGVGDILSGPATERIALRPLALTLEERRESYVLARDHFCAQLARAATPCEPNDIESPCYRAALLLHMRALAAVEGVEVKGEQGVLDYMLDRERRYWSERIRAAGMDDVLLRGISQAMAATTLGGGMATQADAIAVLRKIPLLQDQPQAVLGAIADLLHEVYPGELWIEPVLPDLLGEHLVESELANGSEDLLGLVFDEAPQ